jgi:hypothetical protein
MDRNDFNELNTRFSNDSALQELLLKNVVSKLWRHIDEKFDVDALIYEIVQDLEFADCLEYNDDDKDDFDMLRDMVLHRIGYEGNYD